MAAFAKRTDRYFHLTSWTDVALGVPYPTSWESSAYWSVQLVPPPEHLEHVAGTLPATIPLELRKAIAQLKLQAQRAKEDAFEAVRQEIATEAPSRTNAMYLCESEQQLREHVRAFGFPTAGKRLLELETVTFEDEGAFATLAPAYQMTVAQMIDLNRCRRFRANPKLLDCNSGDHRAFALRYWSGDACESHDLTEVLFRGFFRVVHVSDLVV